MTIYDIAKLAGVSASTVSRVANNKPGIKEETRRQIQALLDEYDYQPNETARGLVNQSSRMIGILITDIRDAHHVDIAYYIEQEMEKQGYCSLIVNTDLSDEKKVQAIKMLSQRQVDGVILVGSTFQCDAVKTALASCFKKEPVVITNGYLELPNVKGVLVDEKEGVEACVELLARKGHRKQAFILPNPTPSNLAKEKGFAAGMEALGWKREDLWIYTAPSTLEESRQVTERILREHPEVEGLIYGEDLAAVSGMRVLHDHKLPVPKRVGVIGVNNSRYCDICFPRLTSLDNRLAEMSFEAARILLDDLEGRKNPEKIMLFSKIVEREST